MGAFPAGEGRYAVVTYAVRDFKASPLPSAVMLNGRRGASVTGLREQVAGIRIGHKADALFLLHAFNQYGQPDRCRDPNPVAFQYTVHYADGRAALLTVTASTPIE